MVDPILTYDSRRVSFIDRPPQSEARRGVEILLSGLLSFLKTEDPGMDFLDFRKVLVVQLELSFLEGCLGRSGRGCHPSIISFQLLSYLRGSGTIFGAARHGFIAMFPEFMGDFDFETSRRLFLLWGRLIGLVRVSVGSLSDSLLDLLTGLWGTRGGPLWFQHLWFRSAILWLTQDGWNLVATSGGKHLWHHWRG